jgi:hypothetical protein
MSHVGKLRLLRHLSHHPPALSAANILKQCQIQMILRPFLQHSPIKQRPLRSSLPQQNIHSPLTMADFLMATLSFFTTLYTFRTRIYRQCSGTRHLCQILTQPFMKTMKYPGGHTLLAKQLNPREQTSPSKIFLILLSRVLVCTSINPSSFGTDVSIDFPVEPPSKEPSFELPRRHGINDSYSTYISQASQDSNTQRYIIEGILGSYGSQSSKDIWLTSLTQGWF